MRISQCMNVMDIFDFKIDGSDGDRMDRMSEDRFIDAIMPKLEDVLKRRFSDEPQKQRIKIIPHQRMQFACPFCGDSAKNERAKRGNFILEDGQFKNTFKCFNCGKFMSIREFFACFKTSLSTDEIEYIATAKPSFSHVQETKDEIMKNILLDADKIDAIAVDREALKNKLDLEECNVDNYANSYLVHRNMFKFEHFLYDRKIMGLYVLNLTSTGKIIGLQVRNLSSDASIPKYRTYGIDKIYGALLDDTDTALTITKETNTISKTFNIMNIDISRPVVVTEGPIDSLFIDNAVASCGSTIGIPLDLPFRYLFDDDDPGRREAVKKLKDGYHVFLWSSLKKDISLPERKKWDVNDVVNWCVEKKMRIPDFSKYFSNDRMDMISI